MSGADFRALRRAVADAAATVERVRAQVEALQRDEVPSVEPAAQAVTSALEALGDARAAALLGQAEEVAVQAAEDRVRSAQQELARVKAKAEAHEATAAGLLRLVARAEQTQAEAAKALNSAMVAWAQGELQKADAEYAQAAKAAGAAAQRVEALRTFLRVRANLHEPGARLDRVHLPPLGAVSLAAAREAWPAELGGDSYAIERDVFVRLSPSAISAALEVEMDALGREDSKDAARPQGVVSGLRAAFQRRVPA